MQENLYALANVISVFCNAERTWCLTSTTALPEAIPHFSRRVQILYDTQRDGSSENIAAISHQLLIHKGRAFSGLFLGTRLCLWS